MTNDTGMDELIAKYSRKGVMLDSSVLILLVVGCYNPERIESFKRTNAFEKQDFVLLTRLLSKFERLVTTPHILTEVSNLCGNFHQQEKHPVFSQLVEVISRSSEESLASKDICNSPPFTRFGLTDSGIAVCAKDRFLVITADLPLFVLLGSLEVDAINFNHLRPLGWQ
ncbi:MAG: PIN domain-containing protein [Planctomycetaceae bacterium]